MRPVLIQLALATCGLGHLLAGMSDRALLFFVGALVVWALRPVKP